MQIKRFEAKTMTAALKLVKDEFGPEAVILSARSLRYGRSLFGVVRTAGVEVTAAKDSGWAAYGGFVRGAGSAMPAPPAPAAPPPPVRRQGLLRSLNHGLKSLASRRSPNPAEAGAGAAPPGLDELYQHLLGQDVRRELAADIVAQVKEGRTGEDPPVDEDRLRRALGGILPDMGQGAPHEAGGGAPRITVLVGPPGVGKTTLAVKIAADQRTRQNAGVGLLTLDDLRIGALEQMRIYAGILGLPMASAASAQEAKAAVAALGSVARIIVDSPGIARAEEERLAELAAVLAALEPKEVHLVLAAGMREKDQLQTIEFWKACGVDRLAFTRLDETGACGALVNLPVAARLPLSYVSSGPRAPGNLALGYADPVVGRLLPPGVRRRDPADPAQGISQRRRHPETGGRFVANRNSDLYHLADCKWVGKIKAANLIRFGTAEEAESKSFQPCRDCCPAQADHAENAWVAEARARGLGRR